MIKAHRAALNNADEKRKIGHNAEVALINEFNLGFHRSGEFDVPHVTSSSDKLTLTFANLTLEQSRSILNRLVGITETPCVERVELKPCE